MSYFLYIEYISKLKFFYLFIFLLIFILFYSVSKRIETNCSEMMKETTNSLSHTLDTQVDKFFPTKRGSLQLWQFLLHLLNNSKQDETNIIEWTRKSSAEFKLLDPEEVNIRI